VFWGTRERPAGPPAELKIPVGEPTRNRDHENCAASVVGGTYVAPADASASLGDATPARVGAPDREGLRAAALPGGSGEIHDRPGGVRSGEPGEGSLRQQERILELKRFLLRAPAGPEPAEGKLRNAIPPSPGGRQNVSPFPGAGTPAAGRCGTKGCLAPGVTFAGPTTSARHAPWTRRPSTLSAPSPTGPAGGTNSRSWNGSRLRQGPGRSLPGSLLTVQERPRRSGHVLAKELRSWPRSLGGPRTRRKGRYR
jgi:hypothetical protein